MRKITDCEHLERVAQKENGRLTARRFHKHNFKAVYFNSYARCFDSCSFQKADLRESTFAEMIIENVDFRKADLRRADLHNAVFYKTDFRSADLRGADFQSTELREVNFENADLRKADFLNAVFRDANIKNAKMPKRLVELPPVGESFIGWKKVCDGIVLKLEILADSPRVSGWTSEKCRAKAVKTLAAYKRRFSYEKSKEAWEQIKTTHERFSSKYDYSFKYKLGEMVSVVDYNSNPLIECAPGIHFFLERTLAENYV